MSRSAPLLRRCHRLAALYGCRTTPKVTPGRVKIFGAPQARHQSSQSQFGLSLEFRDDLAVITMDKGQNTLRTEFFQEFNELLDTVHRREDCRALITTGGGKFYSNGLDLRWLSQVPGEGITDFLRLLDTTLRRVLLFPIPTMAVMNGHAYAGGAILAFAHDMRTLNSERGWIRFTEVIVNIPFSQFMINYLKVRFGGGTPFTDATCLARKYSAQEALADKLIHAAFPRDTLLEESIQLLNGIVPEALPRPGVLAVKQDVFKDAEESYNIMMSQSNDTGGRAIVEKGLKDLDL